MNSQASSANSRGYEQFRGRASEFVSDSEPSWPQPPTSKPDAPNVIIMLVDDLGFSDLGPFGGEIDTPNFDALASDGWVFTNYRTAPMCSPARAALLTGLNPHRAGFGFVAHTNPGYPGFSCEIPATAPTLAESLRAGGYATFHVGKWHLTSETKLHDAADKSSWPLQRGFDRYFGSMDGFTSVHHPHRLVRDNSVVAVESFPEGYFLTDELTTEAIGMIDDLRANDAAKPFFLYYAHTAVHGPVQAKEADIEKYRGKYEAGWQKVREERFRRQRELGIIPADAVLPADAIASGALIPQWDDLSDEERELFARHMEVYAAAVDEVDQSLGHLRAKLEALGEWENTIVVIASDNGGTAEGGPTGTRSYLAQFGISAALPGSWVRDVPRDLAEIGGPKVHNHYPTGWARVSNTPFRSFKTDVYEGGVHAPLIVSWPSYEDAKPGLRDQFLFVSDVAPTILELTGVAPLAERAGQRALVPDGRSAAALLRDDEAQGRELQHFEIFGRRSIIDGDWKLVSTVPPTKAEGAAGGTWELYDLSTDPTETVDLAHQNPEKVTELAEKWRHEAWQNTVFPLDDNGTLHATLPSSNLQFAEPVTLLPFRPPLERYRAAQLTVLRSFEVEIRVHCGEAAAGVLVAHGDQSGGYLLAIDEGHLLISYNAYGEMYRVRGPRIEAGTADIRLTAAEVEDLHIEMGVSVNGSAPVATGPVPMLLGMAPFTGISVGYDYGGPVDWELYEKHGAYRFSGGTIEAVRYVPGAVSVHDRTIIREIDDRVRQIID